MRAANTVEIRMVDRLTREQERARGAVDAERRRAEAEKVEPLAHGLVDGFIAQVENPEPHLRALGSAVHAAYSRHVSPEDAAALFGVLARVGGRGQRPASARAAAERLFKGRAAG